jgi:hypothetical protein
MKVFTMYPVLILFMLLVKFTTDSGLGISILIDTFSPSKVISVFTGQNTMKSPKIVTLPAFQHWKSIC